MLTCRAAAFSRSAAVGFRRRRAHPRHTVAASAVSRDARAGPTSSAASPSSKLSLSVYIEDTDHYQVSHWKMTAHFPCLVTLTPHICWHICWHVPEKWRGYRRPISPFQVAFYANYFKWFLRAREAALGPEALAKLHEQKLRPLVAVEKAKYNGPARLGDAVVRILAGFMCDSRRRQKLHGITPAALGREQQASDSLCAALSPKDLVSTVSRHSDKALRWQQSAVPAGSPSAKPFVAAEILLAFARPDGSLADVPESLLAGCGLAESPPAGGAWKPLAPYKDLAAVSVTEVRVFSDEVPDLLFPARLDVQRTSLVQRPLKSRGFVRPQVSSWGSADEVAILRWFERNRRGPPAMSHTRVDLRLTLVCRGPPPAGRTRSGAPRACGRSRPLASWSS